MTRFAYFCGHEQFHPEVLVRHARLAEEAGFDMVMVSEHFHPWVDDHSAAGFAYSTLGAMAHATERIEISNSPRARRLLMKLPPDLGLEEDDE